MTDREVAIKAITADVGRIVAALGSCDSFKMAVTTSLPFDLRTDRDVDLPIHVDVLEVRAYGTYQPEVSAVFRGKVYPLPELSIAVRQSRLRRMGQYS